MMELGTSCIDVPPFKDVQSGLVGVSNSSKKNNNAYQKPRYHWRCDKKKMTFKSLLKSFETIEEKKRGKKIILKVT